MVVEQESHTKEKRYVESGDRIRKARLYKGLRRDELADAIHCSSGLIASMEQGVRALRYENAVSIASICGVRVEWLFTGAGHMTDKEAVRSIIGQMQNLDVMWTEFLRHVALIAGYTMQEVDRSSASPADVHSPYLRFVKDGDAKSLSMREVNVFISEVEQHSGLALQMLFDRKKGG